ncbi:MAG: HEAT repeat domain-containing protein [Chloracidobacterium sp.]
MQADDIQEKIAGLFSCSSVNTKNSFYLLKTLEPHIGEVDVQCALIRFITLEPCERLRNAAAAILKKSACRPDVQESLVKAIDMETDWKMRQASVDILAWVAGAPRPLQALIGAVTKDGVPAVRAAAAQALTKVSNWPSAQMALLKTLTGDRTAYVRMAAAHALMDVASQPIVQASLLEMLRLDEDAAVRDAIAKSLTKHPPTPYLSNQLLKHIAQETQRTVLETLLPHVLPAMGQVALWLEPLHWRKGRCADRLARLTTRMSQRRNMNPPLNRMDIERFQRLLLSRQKSSLELPAEGTAPRYHGLWTGWNALVKRTELLCGNPFHSRAQHT